MKFEAARGITTAVLWTSSGALMVSGTIWEGVMVVAWGIYVALIACIVTAWIVVDVSARKYRLRVKEIARLLNERHAVKADLPRVGR